MKLKITSIGILIALLWMGCEKEIDLDVPAGETKIVVEGSIETGQPPIVLLSRTFGFFEPTSIESLTGLYIRDAVVRVNGIALQQICTDEISEELLPLVSELVGLSPSDLQDFPICAYIGLNPELTGTENTTYFLEVEALGQNLSSTTHIPTILEPDSVWFRLWANSPKYGFVFTRISDPDTLNNAYRVFTKRIGPNENNPPNPVDAIFYAPFGSAFIDEFFNGESLEIGFLRGQPANSSRESDTGEEAGFFEVGDRFVFKFCSIDQPTYEFFRTFEQQQGTSGSPFAAPNNVISNINGGLGIWAGYACTYDTLIATP